MGTKGRLEGCEIYGNVGGGVSVEYESAPCILRCNIHDHVGGGGERGSGFGVFVAPDATAMVQDCTFARNACGDVKRE